MLRVGTQQRGVCCDYLAKQLHLAAYMNTLCTERYANLSEQTNIQRGMRVHTRIQLDNALTWSYIGTRRFFN